MKRYHHSLIIIAFFLSGCTTVKDPEHPGAKYRVSYVDNNNDGSIDEAFFTSSRIDASFVLYDSNFNGRYDTATVFGYSVEEKIVDFPVYLDDQKSKLNKRFLSPYRADASPKSR